MSPRPLLTWLGLLCGAAGLLLQFSISMQSMLAAGRDLPGALGHFFAYYTILTNIVLVLVYLSEVTATPALALFRKPLVRATMAANIALVGLYVFFVLRFLSDLQGLFLLADIVLHYACPTIYLLWWLAQPHGALRWTSISIMLTPTLVYFVYAMARGAWVMEYPYPVLNAIELGYPQVLLNAIGMTAALGVLMVAVIWLDMALAKRQQPTR